MHILARQKTVKQILKAINMKHNNTSIIIVPVMLSFYIMGFVDIVGVATAYIKHDFNLSDSVAQLLPFMVFLWFALISIPSGILQDRLGKRFMVNIGQIITGVGLIIPFLFYSYLSAILGFALIGIGNTVLQVSANPLLLSISLKGNSAANLSLSQFIKATASMLGPIIAAAFARYAGDWRLVLIVYAVLSIISALWLSSVKHTETKSDKEPASFGSVMGLLRKRYILMMVMGVFLIVGFDVGMNSNIAIFLSRKFAIDLESASMGISIYFAALMVGRLTGAFVLRKLHTRWFLLFTTILTIAGLLGIIFTNSLTMARIMIFLAGLGFANIFPVLFAVILEYKPNHANELSSLIILSVSGGAIIPPVMGVLSDAFGVSTSIYVLVFCMLYVLFASIVALKRHISEK